MTARYAVHDGIAVISLDNPPVNGLGFETRRALVEGLDRALADPAVVAVVISGSGKGFSGGADIKRVRHAQGARRAEPADVIIGLLEDTPSR